MNNQVAQWQQVRRSINQVIRHKEICDWNRIPKISKLSCCKAHRHNYNILSWTAVSNADEWTFRHGTATALNISAIETIADLASRCSSALWFWFLLLPAAQQGWSVSPCTLETSTFGRERKTAWSKLSLTDYRKFTLPLYWDKFLKGVFFLLGDSPPSEFYMQTFGTLSVPSS